MKIKSKNGLLIILGCCLSIGILVATGLAISDGIQLTLPEEPIRAEQVVPPVVPALVSPEESEWEEVNPSTLAPETKLAYLNEEYEKTSRTMIHFIETEPEFTSGKVAYAILSEVKYESEDNCTVVTLSEASPEACEAKAIYGASTVSLASGEKAFIKDNLKGSYPRSIALVRDNKVITIVTTASREELIKMADGVIQNGN